MENKRKVQSESRNEEECDQATRDADSTKLAARASVKRSQLGWSQEYLATKAGVSPKTVLRFENDHEVYFSSACRILRALNIPVGDQEGEKWEKIKAMVNSLAEKVNKM